MTVDPHTDLPDARLLRALWTGLLLAPTAFLLNLEVAYALVPTACSSRAPVLVHLVHLGCLALAGFGGDLARWGRRPDQSYPFHGRTRALDQRLVRPGHRSPMDSQFHPRSVPVTMIDRHDLWTAWSFEPAVVIGLGLSLLLYLGGCRAVWQNAGRSHGVRSWEAACFAGGWFILAIALVSPLHHLGGVLFSAHM